MPTLGVLEAQHPFPLRIISVTARSWHSSMASFLFVSTTVRLFFQLRSFSYPLAPLISRILDAFTNDVLTLGCHEWRGSSTAGPLNFASRSSCSTLVHFFVVDFVSLIWTSASFCFSLWTSFFHRNEDCLFLYCKNFHTSQQIDLTPSLYFHSLDSVSSLS